MSQFDIPHEGPHEDPDEHNKNTENVNGYGRPTDDNPPTPHFSDHKPNEVMAEQSMEELPLEEQIIQKLQNKEPADPSTTELLGEWEERIRNELYSEYTGKVDKFALDATVHEEFLKIEDELFHKVLNDIKDENKRKEFIKFMEQKRQ